MNNQHPRSATSPQALKKEPNEAEALDFSDSCFSKSICSSTDCTGLIPALPSSEAELEAYEEMYQFCLQGLSGDTPTRLQTSERQQRSQ